MTELFKRKGMGQLVTNRPNLYRTRTDDYRTVKHIQLNDSQITIESIGGMPDDKAIFMSQDPKVASMINDGIPFKDIVEYLCDKDKLQLIDLS